MQSVPNHVTELSNIRPNITEKNVSENTLKIDIASPTNAEVICNSSQLSKLYMEFGLTLEKQYILLSIVTRCVANSCLGGALI